VKARPIKVECLVQSILVLRAQLAPRGLDLVMPLRRGLREMPLLLLIATLVRAASLLDTATLFCSLPVHLLAFSPACPSAFLQIPPDLSRTIK
jgi:hypothetical protein